MSNHKVKIFTHFGIDCELTTGTYTQGGIAVRAVVASTARNISNNEIPGLPFGTLSVNTGHVFPENAFAFKTYSENAGLFEVCLKAGLIEDTGEFTVVGSGNVIPIARLI